MRENDVPAIGIAALHGRFLKKILNVGWKRRTTHSLYGKGTTNSTGIKGMRRSL